MRFYLVFYAQSVRLFVCIDGGNLMFAFPIWLFGADLVSNVITVTNLYISLCVIHICLTLFYLRNLKKLGDSGKLGDAVLNDPL